MLLRVGCEFDYESDAASPAVLLVEPHPDASVRLVREEWRTEPAMTMSGYDDLFGNRCRRVVLPTGATRLRYDAVVELSRAPDDVDPTAAQAPVEQLPASVLVYTLPSRYCLSDALADTAWQLFGDTEPGWPRVQAVCDWIQRQHPIRPREHAADDGRRCLRRRRRRCVVTSLISAITFCRALNIPARYVFGYMPDIDVPAALSADGLPRLVRGLSSAGAGGPSTPASIGRASAACRSACGRDAVDVAMVTTYGPARFRSMVVWTDEIPTDAPPAAVVTATGAAPEVGLGA